MKKYLLVAILFFSLKTDAQITLDTLLDPVQRGSDFYMAQISQAETKYVFLDTVTNTFSLYNMDFSPFLLSIAVPEPFNQYNMQPVYITRALFDCDTSNIEFAYEAPVNSLHRPFYIMRTDGTLLFQLDSANGPYCLGGCLGMTDIIVPIKNTSDGAKLWLQKTNSQKLFIYSLCGTLPTDIFDFTTINTLYVKIFPNPSAGLLTFEINFPDNIHEFELVIIDSNAKGIRSDKLIFGSRTHVVDVSSFSNGAYYFSLRTKSKVYQTGKFILTK